jgi:DtxR family Mn-dependent transcriptional regulator
MANKTIEDYLKATYQLQTRGTRVRTSQLANSLEVTSGSVTAMIKRLAEHRPALVTYLHHQGIRLTPPGEKIALSVIRRHRLLETFLHQTLGLNWDEVHQEAEILEHCLSERVTEALDRFLGRPERDPHGDPIPDPQGQFPQTSRLSLSELAVGKRFRVVRVQPAPPDFLKFLNGEQISIGTTGTLLSRTAFDGIAALEMETGKAPRKCSLSQQVSERIFVEDLGDPGMAADDIQG